MNKFCVFCGEIPINKTKEHIIPQWLIKYTGEPKRNISVGIDYKNKKSRSFAFDKLTLPACKKCNEEFSNLEAKVKPIILKLLESEIVETNEVNILLDWLDKVRIGLWLLFYSLDQNPLNIKPGFKIDKRIGQCDRMTIIYKLNNMDEGINFFGVDTPAFQIQPSCFSIRINNYCFFNVSKEFLFSRRIGFPYPQKTCIIETSEFDRMLVLFQEGINRKLLPLIRNNHFIDGVELYQPMIMNSFDQARGFYENDYVKSNCLNHEDGIGNIFFYDKKNKKLLGEQKIQFSNKEHNLISLIMQTLKYQNTILEENSNLELLISEERIKYFKESSDYAILFNNRLINILTDL